jgi:hypothetical protein
MAPKEGLFIGRSFPPDTLGSCPWMAPLCLLPEMYRVEVIWMVAEARRLEYTRERGKNRPRPLREEIDRARHPIASISDFLQFNSPLNRDETKIKFR